MVNDVLYSTTSEKPFHSIALSGSKTASTDLWQSQQKE